MNNLTYDADRFYLDGEPHTIVSGTIHYFRVPRAYWHDRLAKLRACGFNTVETYTCWNLHERTPGVFNFADNLDLAAFLDEAAAVGLQVILRPGPYICAEWEFGGLPSWLLTIPHLPLRCYDPRFLELVERYYTALFAHLRGRLACDGGNVIMVQIENEYGSYGDDHRYMQAVADIYIKLGVDVPLFTSDGPCHTMFTGGTLPGTLAVANFGSRADKAFDYLEENRPGQPKMCGEFWDGWFDHWYEEHHVRVDGGDIGEMRTMLDRGGSFNMYMFHGGTNFGFLNGANHSGQYQPTVTSYDYNAPLSEAGDMTPKYFAIKAMLEDYFGPAPDLDVADTPKAAYGAHKPNAIAPLFDNLDAFPAPVESAMPMTMEELGQDFGFVLYRSTMEGPRDAHSLVLGEPRDRVHIFLDGHLAGIRERDRRDDEVRFGLGKGEQVELALLVENMGRVNYGPRLCDEKGLIAGVRMAQFFHFGWTQQALRMEPDELARLHWSPVADVAAPAFYRFTVTVDTPADTFLRLDGFTHGFAMLNGHNLGRFYNPAGPQKTLYVPAPWLKSGENELIVFETDAATDPTACFLDAPELG